MRICPDCYNDVTEWETHCKCGWEAPKRVIEPIKKIFARKVREPETEATKLARERCMQTAKTFSIGSGDPRLWAHKLAAKYHAGERITTAQLAALKNFERNTGERVLEVAE